MQTRYMERSNSMAREKRGLDSAAAEEGQPDRKRPALARFSVCFLPRNWKKQVIEFNEILNCFKCLFVAV